MARLHHVLVLAAPDSSAGTLIPRLSDGGASRPLIARRRHERGT
jgi:hypothetical protein